ncbi:rod-determining factor RdfA [Natrinema gelatinilyticum]|uniref:rod-determining factor RdfA n=1 Tax=Natrinema gelatinilyticum TaxID=2961571 RepID=UPI0020C416F1|nr:rod-determining factor RdfA [Natrinema gelatinilyticum]
MTRTNAGVDEPTYKAGKVIERYDLKGMGERLERRWLGVDGEAHSLRKLAEEFNLAVLEAALRASGDQPLTGEVETAYRALVDEDVSSGDRTQVRRTLERNGIDVDRLEGDFVTHQAIYTYLTKGRGVSKETGNADQVESARGTIKRLQSRLSAVTETSLSQLRDAGVIALGKFEVLITVDVVCTDCGAHRSVTELLDEQGCECDV